METRQFKQAPRFTCSPTSLFMAWLDADAMAEMIGADVKIDPKVGGKFSFWDDYLIGVTLEIDPAKQRIVQTWRDTSTDWPENHYSKITLQFTADKSNTSNTRLRFWHSGIPAKHAKSIEEGWTEYFWEPMQKFYAAG